MSRATGYPFQDVKLPVEERVRDLVSRFTIEEKISLMVQYQPAVERLGVKPYKHGTEAAHGVAWLGEATAFPQPIGLACTWNRELLRQVGSAIGDEARVFYQRNPAVNGLTLWAPTVDMERDPRWGRTEEAYGEDPRLAGDLASALIQGVQGDHPVYKKAVATLKHFVGNNNEVDRGSCSVTIDPRNMREYYHKPFEAAFTEGGALSMMTSYNAVNGVPTILHEDVQNVVKGEWGMDGFIVSDAGDLLGIVNDHRYCESYKEAVAYAIKAGIDSITDDREKSCQAIEEALREGLLEEADLDRALINTFRVRFRLGEFDPDELNPYANMPESKVCAQEHAQLSLEAAREAVVLLKNNSLLPLDKAKAGKVAVIGPLADAVYRDWYSGTLPYKVTPLEGVAEKLGNGNVTYRSGLDRVQLKRTADGRFIGLNEQGKLSAAAEKAETFVHTDWGWGSHTLWSETAERFVTSEGDEELSAASKEAFGWYVKEIVRFEECGDNRDFELRSWNGEAVHASADGTLKIAKEAGRPAADRYALCVVENGLEEAVAAAREAETAIVFVGNNPLINGKEEIDWEDLVLPAKQEELIRAVLAVNPNTVVVVIGSYPFAINWAEEHAPAIVYSSHAGQELGRALADVLFGDYNPAGRLPMTWYRSVDQLADIMDYDIRKGKRTYQYFDGEPLYPFGHGLSYSSFDYVKLVIEGYENLNSRQWTARVTVRNTGDRAGDEVVQLYATVAGSRAERPLKKLVAFERVSLKPGEKRELTLWVRTSDLQLWDVTRDRFVLEAGTYTFAAGGSSADLRLTAALAVDGEVIPARKLDRLVQADRYDDYESVMLTECKEGGTAVAAVGGEGSIVFKNVAYDKAPASLELRANGGKLGGSAALYFGDPGTVEPACVVNVGPGEEQQWANYAGELNRAEPTSQVVLALSGSVQVSAFRLV